MVNPLILIILGVIVFFVAYYYEEKIEKKNQNEEEGFTYRPNDENQMDYGKDLNVYYDLEKQGHYHTNPHYHDYGKAHALKPEDENRVKKVTSLP